MTDIDNAYALITQYLDYLHRQYSPDELKQALAQRPRLLEMLRQLVDQDAPPAPSELAPFSTSGNQFLLNGQPFRFTGYNIRAAAYFGEPLEETRYGDFGFLEHEIRVAKELEGKVLRFYSSHVNYTIEQSIPRVLRVLDLLKQYEMYAIVALTDGVHSGFGIRDTEQNFRGRHTHEFYAGGYEQNYLPKMLQMVEAIKDHPAMFMVEPGNEFLVPFPPFVSATPTPGQYNNILNLFRVASDAIRAISPTKLIIGTGVVSARELFADQAYDNRQLAKQLYALPNINAASVHSYQSRNNSHRWGEAGFNLEREMQLQGHPIYIGETGMISGTQDGGWTARLGSETSNRTSGLLQWALHAWHAPRAGGDAEVGMNQHESTMWHHYTGNMRYLANEVYR